MCCAVLPKVPDSAVVRRQLTCRDSDDNGVPLREASIVYDGADNVLLADYINNAVHVLSTSGVYLRKLLGETEGVFRPYGLTLDRQRRVLYVGQTGEIKVFVLDGRWNYRLDVCV